MNKTSGVLAAAFAVCFMLFLVSARFAGAFEVPDTGITACYDAAGNQILPCPGPDEPYYGQDGNVNRNSMSFTDNADGTLTDNVTGLVWQKMAAATSMSWAAAATSCSDLNTTTLGGHSSGWRLPALVELNSILDLSGTTGAAAINPVFTGIAAAGYWSSTDDPDDSANAWILNFGSTEDDIAAKATSKYALCVWTEVAP